MVSSPLLAEGASAFSCFRISIGLRHEVRAASSSSPTTAVLFHCWDIPEHYSKRFPVALFPLPEDFDSLLIQGITHQVISAKSI